MTAADALADKSIRQEIEVKAHTSEPTVRAFLQGVFPARVGLAGAVLRAAEAAGVDLATIPVLSAEEQANRRRSSSVKMAAEIARLKELVRSEREVADAWRAASGRIVALVLGEPCIVAMPDHTEEVVTSAICQLRARVSEIESQLATRESGGPFVPVVYPPGTVAAIDAEDAQARERVAAVPTPPPVPIRAKVAKPAPVPRVKLEGFPPEALDPPAAESGLAQLLGDVDRAAHG